MNIIFNGGNIFGGGISMINGKIIGMDENSLKNYDERKSESVSGVKRIEIESSIVGIEVNEATSDKVEVHLFGTAHLVGNLKLDMQKSGNTIHIFSSVQGNTFFSNLTLTVSLPRHAYETVKVKSVNGGIKVAEISAQFLELQTQNGIIDSNAVYQIGKFKTMNGSMDIELIAQSDVQLLATTMNGSIEIRLSNIGKMNLSTSSMNGRIRNRYHSDGIYAITGEVSSMNGSITIG